MICANKRKSFWSYNVIFILVCVIGYSPFLTWGKSLIWEIDGIGQYYPSFLYIGQYLRECLCNWFRGNFVLPLFDISIGMGEDIIGTLNYYGFGDPLNILAVFATKTNGAYVFTGMYFLRLYLAGLCFRKYCAYFGLDQTLSNAGALCYIFSGYALIGGARYMQFLAPMIYLPLISLGFEKILHEKKVLLFIFSVAYAATCNFYFLYMTSLFLVIYCIVRCVSVYGIKNLTDILKSTAISIGSYLLGIMLAAPVLLPSICAFLNSHRNSMDWRGCLLSIENYLPDKYKCIQYIKGAGIEYTESLWTGLPLIQCICLVVSVLAYKSRRNRQCALAVILGTIFWCMPITSIILSGFGKVYTRWVFLLYFVYAVVFICCMDEILKKERGKIFILLTVILNICINSVILYGVGGGNWNNEFVAFSTVHNYIDSPVKQTDSIWDDDAIYRIANETYTNINGRPENIAMLNGYNGLNFWFSIINGNVQKMIDQISTYNRTDWRSYGFNNITIYETLAGVKYYIGNENSVEKIDYEYIKDVAFGDKHLQVYRNKNTLPLVYTYNECITEEFFDQLNALEKVEAVARYVVLDHSCINPVEKMDPILLHEVDAIKEKNAQNIYITCVTGDTEIYLEIDSNDLQDNFGSFILNNKKNMLYVGKKDKVIIYNLGTKFANSKLTFSMNTSELRNEDADRILEQTKLYVMDRNKYRKTIQERNTLQESNILISENQVEIENVYVMEECWMLLALPYNSNWKCYVDGKKTDIYKGNTMYMAVRLAEGRHEIKFIYRNISFYIGIILSLTALCIVLIRNKKSFLKL